jgi:hypothetical protein
MNVIIEREIQAAEEVKESNNRRDTGQPHSLDGNFNMFKKI